MTFLNQRDEEETLLLKKKKYTASDYLGRKKFVLSESVIWWDTLSKQTKYIHKYSIKRLEI
jgi:hypothetical protein